MSAKKEPHANDRATAKRIPPRGESASAGPSPARLPQAVVLRRARLDPASLTRRDVVQLQRAVGNAAVAKILSRAARPEPAREDKQPTKKDVNATGLPDGLKAGVESLSGISLNDVRVHYNSSDPARLHALAYTQGADIRVGPGQERHLAHEAWHVVQQKQGRVRATTRVPGGAVNDDPALEREADAMGAKAATVRPSDAPRDSSPGRGGVPPSGGGTIQRTIRVGPGAGVKVNNYSLAQGLALTKGTVPYRHLMPIAIEWLGPKGGEHQAASFDSLKTELVRELTRRWIDELKAKLPTLYGYLTEEQFNTVVYMSKLTNAFDPAPLEAALKAVKAAAHVEQSTIKGAITPGKLPVYQATFGIFAVDWAAMIPGVEGLVGEFEAAARVVPSQLPGHQKVRLSQDFDLAGSIGGQTTQDADISFVSTSGEKVLVEVAATVDRLRTKMGVAGTAQRQRYERVRELNENVALAYSTPRAKWIEFFTGDTGTSIAERLPTLDGEPGWGLMIDGQYASPADLDDAAGIIRAAEPHVTGFWDALRASGLSFSEVAAMDAQKLASRLQRNVKH